MMLSTTTLADSPSILQDLFFGGTAASHAAAKSDALFLAITWFSIISFIVTIGAMVYFVFKYRRKPGVPVEPSPHHNTLLEILWTVVPSASMLVMFVLGFQGYTEKVVAPSTAMELKIDAWKWGWKVTYPNGASSPEQKFLEDKMILDGTAQQRGLQYPVFYVPEDTDIRLRMHSQDVIHSFWIPEFRTKMDVIPNRYTGYGFRTPKVRSGEQVTWTDDNGVGHTIPGRDMWVFCAEYCGDEHSRMAATLRVVPREVFNEKVAEWARPKSPWVLGKQLWEQQCRICHSIDGSPGTGPSWQGLVGSQGPMSDGSVVEKDPNYIRESILNPNARVVQGYAPAMPSFQGQLSDEDIEGIIAFMRSPNEQPAADAAGEEAAGESADGSEG